MNRGAALRHDCQMRVQLSHTQPGMTYLGPQKSGLVLGALVGGWHLVWAIIVAVG